MLRLCWSQHLPVPHALLRVLCDQTVLMLVTLSPQCLMQTVLVTASPSASRSCRLCWSQHPPVPHADCVGHSITQCLTLMQTVLVTASPSASCSCRLCWSQHLPMPHAPFVSVSVAGDQHDQRGPGVELADRGPGLGESGGHPEDLRALRSLPPASARP